MFLKKFLRYFTFALVLGAILILGFLAFSGIYVLIPILGLAISAFLLSVIFEGEIFYQNISKAIKSLIKPYYIESKLAEECLQEAITDIDADYELINAIDELTEKLDISTVENDVIRKKYEKIKSLHERQKQNSKFSTIRNYLIKTDIPSQEMLESFLCKKARSVNVMKQLSFAKPTINHEIKEKLLTLKNQIISELVIPQFFTDYAQIATIDHAFAHINPTPEAEERKKTLNVSLGMLEQIFTEQLFPHTQPKQNQTIRKMDPAAKPRDVDSSSVQIQEYKDKLRTYLEERYVEKYKKMLPKRKAGSKFIKVLSTVCACFMMLGTSYLLVEAFAVVPLLATIPFGILPAVIVPLAVLAGIAYGIQTYRALDEILNSDIVSKRIAKIKEDLKNGLTLYTGTKLVIFFLLLGLAVTLTVCTGGTWYTVIKHTKPLFSWLSKIPAAVSGIIAGFLAIAACAFNISNSAQTSEELEEAFESQVPEDHPYNIDLLEVPEGSDIERCIRYIERTAIIKQGKKYFIHCRPSNSNKWERIEVPEGSYLIRALLNRLTFANKILYFSVFNSALYSLIRKSTEHKFNPSKENWKQFLNPFRILLLFTYVPIRFVLFLGHLASISATSDRLPGIPEVISMIIGFIAELFEDLHYFTSFNHNHKTDIPAIISEHLKGEDGCDHANDLPTRVLRDFLFAPIFWLAAAWHSIYSDKKTVMNEKEEVPSISISDAFEKLRGKKPKSNPKLDNNSENTVANIEDTINSEKKLYHKDIEDKEDLVQIPKSCNELIKTLISTKLDAPKISIFANHKKCVCHPPEMIRNQVITTI